MRPLGWKTRNMMDIPSRFRYIALKILFSRGVYSYKGDFANSYLLAGQDLGGSQVQLNRFEFFSSSSLQRKRFDLNTMKTCGLVMFPENVMCSTRWYVKTDIVSEINEQANPYKMIDIDNMHDKMFTYGYNIQCSNLSKIDVRIPRLGKTFYGINPSYVFYDKDGSAYSIRGKSTVELPIPGVTNTNDEFWLPKIFTYDLGGDVIDTAIFDSFRFFNANDAQSYPSRCPVNGQVLASNDMKTWYSLVYWDDPGITNANYAMALERKMEIHKEDIWENVSRLYERS